MMKDGTNQCTTIE